MRSTYYAVGISKLTDLMIQAGFEKVRRYDGRFFQPVIIGARRERTGWSIADEPGRDENHFKADTDTS